MKKSELIFNIISIPLDAIMLIFASLFSFYLRQNSISLVGPIIYGLDLMEFFFTALKVIPVLIIIFAFFGLYNLRGTRNFRSEFGKIFAATSLGLLLVILLFFFDQSIFPSRFIILSGWVLGIVFVVVGRFMLRLLQTRLFIAGFGLHNLIVISNSEKQNTDISEAFLDRSFGYKVTANINFTNEIIQKLSELYKNQRVDEILQADPKLSDEINLKLLEFARGKGINFSFVPNLFEVQRNSIETHSLKGIPVISLKNTPLDGWGKVAKRLLDVLISALCLILTSPLFLLIAIAIKLDSPGKIIYSALRGGQGGNFLFYKFRTMYQHLSVGEEYGGREAEQIRQELWKVNSRGGKDGPFLKIKHDPRVTKVGKFLRKTKLDEIPQFWNVLLGNMSMVGPRAHVLDEVQRYKDRYPRMFSIKPGIFGMSQIAQVSWPDLPFEEEIRLNIYYIENWSLWLDFTVLIKSFWLLVFGAKSKEDY